MTKIYTKTGDAGETTLFGGRRVSKSHARIEAYGLVDQVNAELGVARLYVGASELDALLHRVQSELFTIGADLATPHDVRSDYIVRTSDLMVEQLEHEIDQFEAELPPLKTFILPGGTPGAAHLHLARTLCRNAERATVHLSTYEAVSPAAVRYLNRLSDWLFVLARVANHRQQVDDIPWISPANVRQSGQAPGES